MSRGRTQIVADARFVTQAVRVANRPLGLSEITETLMRDHRSQSDKQVRRTVACAVDMGLLCKRGRSLWDIPAIGRTDAVVASPGFSGLFVECASRLLDLDSSSETCVAIRVLLRAASGRNGAPNSELSTKTTTGPAPNGAQEHAHREVEVRQPLVRT